MYPNRSLLERGVTAPVRRQVGEQLDQCTAPAFEAICQDHIWRLAASGALGFFPRTVGRWWDDHAEIDVVALGDEDILLGACTWSTRPVGTDVLADLQRNAQPLLHRGPWRRVHYVLFSRSGFTPAFLSHPAPELVHLIDLDAIASGQL